MIIPSLSTQARNIVTRVFDSRQNRTSNPDGEFDHSGRWYPSTWERCSCCDDMRSPSRAYPYSYMLHCRTRQHVEKLVRRHGCRHSSIQAEARRGHIERPAPTRACPDGIAYKLVAVLPDGGYASIYDGSPWVIGVERSERCRQDHNGGLYVYESASEAAQADVPDNSLYRAAPRIVLQCQVAGAYCRYNHGKLAYSRVTPIAVIS